MLILTIILLLCTWTVIVWESLPNVLLAIHVYIPEWLLYKVSILIKLLVTKLYKTVSL